MLLALSALAIMQTGPEKVMHAYWDQMAAAKRVYVEGRMRGAMGSQDYLFYYWLEKPDRIRYVAKDREERWEGRKHWTLDLVRHTYSVSDWNPELSPAPAALAPFFGDRKLAQADEYDWSDGRGPGTLTERGSMRPHRRHCIRLTDPNQPGMMVLLDSERRLPIGQESSGNQGSYPSYVQEIRFDENTPYRWPSLEFWRQVKDDHSAPLH